MSILSYRYEPNPILDVPELLFGFVDEVALPAHDLHFVGNHHKPYIKPFPDFLKLSHVLFPEKDRHLEANWDLSSIEGLLYLLLFDCS